MDDLEVIVEQVCVVGQTGSGPDLFFCRIRCRGDQYNDGIHYDAAKDLAAEAGYETPMVAIDAHDPAAGQGLMELRFEADWERTKLHDITEETELHE